MVCMEKSLDGISNGFPLRQMVFVRISPIGLNEITVIGNGIDNADAIMKIQAGGGLDEL